MAEGPNDDTKTCSICWEEFINPKMLKCRHTFCLPCLEGFQKKSENKEEINCPLCRQKQTIHDGSFDKLLDNYFVKLRSPEPLEKLCCNVCFEEAILKTCSHCDLKFCSSCKSSHKLALRLSAEKYELSSDSESDEIEESNDVDLSDDAKLPGHLALSFQTIKTKPNATLVSSFQVSSATSIPECGQKISITTIHSIGNGLCEVIIDLGPECVLLDGKGVELQREFFDNGITDIVDIGLGRKIISNYHLGMLLKVETGKGVQLFSRTDKMHPVSVCQLNNGEIACVGSIITNRRDDDMRNSIGELLFFDKHGTLLRKITGDSHNKTNLKYPIGMSYSRLNNSLCISDPGNNCVLILQQDGELLHRYTGDHGDADDRNMMLTVQIPFQPRPICHDETGNIIVGNIADSTIHILNNNGCFLGYLATRCKTGFGNPLALKFDSQNRLWIGDAKDGTIRIFEITSYTNMFPESLSSSFSELSIRMGMT